MTNTVYHLPNNASPGKSKAMRSALACAERGQRVFPCEPAPSKRPLTPHGFHDASTDPRKITAWWNRHPHAAIGVPTGEMFFVLDVDRPEALEELRKHGELPATWTVKTPSVGFHLCLQAVEGITNSPGGLPAGIDVRGEGGYVLVPPSAGYTVEDRSPIAEAPGWLLDILQEKPAEKHRRQPRGLPETASGDSARGAVPAESCTVFEGPPIFEGTRNITLTSIAGRLRARGAGDADLEQQLHDINGSRCVPGLPEGEVVQIIRSATRWPVGNARGAPDAETLEALDLFAAGVVAESWSGAGGKTKRSVLLALVQIGRRHGATIPAGVRVSISERQLALAAGTSRSTVQRAVWRLRRAGWVSRDDAERSPEDGGAFVLRTMRANSVHPYHRGSTRPDGGVDSLCAHPLSSHRLRWSAPICEGVDAEGRPIRVGTEYRLGKSAEQVVDLLEASGGELELGDLYAAMYPHKDPGDRRRWRPRDLRKRNVSRLEEAGVVETEGDTLRLAGEWLERLNEERERAGEIDAYRRDLARYQRETEAYQKDLSDKDPAETAPEAGDTAQRRETGAERRKEAIETGIARLFKAHPEYRERRVGQITCALSMFDMIPEEFPRGVAPGGLPNDHEVEEVLVENGVEVAA